MCEERNEFVVRDELAEKRKNIKSFTGLTKFLKDVTENYGNGYSEAPRSIAQASLAVAYFLSDKYGITGFQAGFVMWDFMFGWSFSHNKCGLKIIDWDEMLYPQYCNRFEKTIRNDTWCNIQKQAKKKLEENPGAAPRVVEHWKNIVDGVVPFGYVVKD